jgi:hypothetical protein
VCLQVHERANDAVVECSRHLWRGEEYAEYQTQKVSDI